MIQEENNDIFIIQSTYTRIPGHKIAPHTRMRRADSTTPELGHQIAHLLIVYHIVEMEYNTLTSKMSPKLSFLKNSP